MGASSNTTTPVPDRYTTPSFPSLYWLIGPKDVVSPRYLYHLRDVWRFTLYWMIIIFEAAHLAAATYAVAIIWWGGRKQRNGLGMSRTKSVGVTNEPALQMGREESRSNSKAAKPGMKGTGISGMWIVPLVYGVVAGIEAVVAGSVIGLLYVIGSLIYWTLELTETSLGALYNAGGYRMSTWIPFVWSLISVLVLIVSSFSIQGGL